MNTTVSVENKNQKKWEPNREGPRFKEFFEIKKEDNIDINEKSISDQASLILSKCINPNEFEEVNLNSTGLVIGQVQSGKTLSMTSVTAMAKDNGFGIVVVLSGAVTPLSFQTAERIAKELKGRRIIKIINNPKDRYAVRVYEDQVAVGYISRVGNQKIMVCDELENLTQSLAVQLLEYQISRVVTLAITQTL